MFNMRKEIKQWGNSAVLVLSTEDMKAYGLEIGDFVDISDIVKVQKEVKKK